MFRSIIAAQVRSCVAAALLLSAAVWVGPLQAQQAQPSAHSTLQDTYVDSLREQLRRSSRYPTGREASHQRAQGEVTLRFALARDGRVGDVQVVRSSDSMLLDGAALAAVRRAAYPAFMAGLYPGQSGHDFQVTLAFAPAGEAGRSTPPYYAQVSVQALGGTDRR